MIYTERMSEAISVPALGIVPFAGGAGTYTTAAVPLTKLRRVLFTVQVGAMGASSTVNFNVQGCSTSGGTFVDIPNTSITPLAQSGGNGSQEVIVEITAEQVAALNLGYQFLKGKLVIATAATPSAVLVQGGVSRYEPASTLNDASVVQTVVL
jgi:hypothetical protein